jgi:hypothetical protein
VTPCAGENPYRFPKSRATGAGLPATGPHEMGWPAEEMRHSAADPYPRPRARREHRWHEALPADPRDPEVVRAKALARAGDRAGGRTPRPSPSPGPAQAAG